MNTRYYHTPLKVLSSRPSCPVCHESVYSKAGIHPQCAVFQSDPPRLRGKKKPASALVEPAATVGDPGAANVVSIPPTAERTAAPDRAVILELASIPTIAVNPTKAKVRAPILRAVRLPT